MKENRAILYLGIFTIILLMLHFVLAGKFGRSHAQFIVYSYLLIFGMSTIEIGSLQVRNTSYSNLMPYIVLGMSLIKMIVSILWIFYAISLSLITTDSVMVHFFVPYFLMLAFTAWLMIRVMR